MKIALINNLYEPYAVGGAETVVKTTAEELAKTHDVTIITTMPFVNRQSWRPILEQVGKLKIYRFCPINIYHYLKGKNKNIFFRFLWNIIDNFNWHSYLILKKIIKHEKFDLIVTHNLKGFGYLTFKAIESCEVKHLHVLHDVQYAIPSGLLISGEEKRFINAGFPVKLYQAVNRWLFNTQTIIISPSQWLIKFYQDLNYWKKQKTVILPNPTKLKVLNTTQNSKTNYNKLLFVGQINQAKGINFLLEAIKDEDITLEIVGEGSELKKLENQYENNSKFHFNGYQPTEKLAEFYSQADYLIVPSLCYENFPTIILEAFTHSLPVIGSDLAGIKELVGDKGWLFKAGNKDSLLKTLEQAKKDTHYLDKSNRAKEFIKNLNPSDYCVKLLEL